MTVCDMATGNLDPYNGYGIMGLELVRHSERCGVHVNTICPRLLNPNNQDAGLKAILMRAKRVPQGTIALGYPTLIDEWAEKDLVQPVVCLTMFESTKLPDGWVPWLNRCAAVVVPCRWNADVFRDNGVTAPLHVVPLGVPAYDYVPRRVDREPFTFLTLGDRGTRKGWDVAVKAFHQAFGDDPRFRLIVKRRRDARVTVRAANVEYLNRDMADDEMQALYADADCYIDANRGEGFGLMGRQAAATGLPVIATNFGGTADDIRAWAYPLRWSPVPAWLGEDRGRLGDWAEPDQDHLAQLMQYVAERRAMALYMGREAARRIRRLYRWDVFADNMFRIWQDAVTGQPVTDRRRRMKARKA